MAKPVIGITPLVDYGRESLWMLPGYMDGVAEAGGLSVMLPLTEDPEDIARILARLDGLIIAGGQDVSPEVYGAQRLPLCGETCPERDRMESALLDAAMAARMPVLGICRGIQFINAHLGGTLWQDLPAQHPSEVDHHQPAPYDRPIHTVRLLPGTPLRDLLDTETLPVNSCHHQAVRNLAPALLPMAMAGDGIVEAAYSPDLPFLWAVQWHPEFSHREDGNSKKIFRALVRACG